MLASFYGLSVPVLIIAEVLLLGIVLSSAIEPIYQIYEGLKWRRLTQPLRQYHESRKQRLIESKLRITGGVDRDLLTEPQLRAFSEVYAKLNDYPLQRDGAGEVVRVVAASTLLGNIIATYETYADTRYGVETIFYWFHFLSGASESARKRFDEQYTYSESLVLTSAAGLAIAIVHGAVLLGFAIHRLIPAARSVSLGFSGATSVVFCIGGCLAALVFYGFALPAHRETARIVRAIIDSHVNEIVALLFGLPVQIGAEQQKTIERVTEYLRDLD